MCRSCRGCCAACTSPTSSRSWPASTSSSETSTGDRAIAPHIGWGTTLAIKTIVVLGFVPLSALILGYTFLLKMMSHMQSRLGPMDPGGFHGWYQLVGDGVKFMQKEDIMPSEADRRVFALAPAIVVMSTFLVFVVVPAGSPLLVGPLVGGLFLVLLLS